MDLKPQDLLVLLKVAAHPPAGSVKGPTLSPLYRTAPQAAMADPALHRLLALLDALRTGRARERSLAAKLMEAELMRTTAPAASSCPTF